jgi:ribosomal protein S7
MSDASVFQARRRKRIDLAEQWLADIPEKTEYGWMRLRGEAGILEAKGDISGALKKLDEIEAMILAVSNQAVREISLRGLRRWKLELQPQTVIT